MEYTPLPLGSSKPPGFLCVPLCMRFVTYFFEDRLRHRPIDLQSRDDLLLSLKPAPQRLAGQLRFGDRNDEAVMDRQAWRSRRSGLPRIRPLRAD